MNLSNKISLIVFLASLTIVASCSVLAPEEDNGHISWANVDSINRIWRNSSNSVTLECTISLPNPCYTHKNTNVEKSDSAWTIELESRSSGEECYQVIHAEIITIDLPIPENTEQRLLFLAFGEVNIDTVLSFN